MKDHELVWLYEDDLAVLMTDTGKMIGVWAHTEDECLKNADMMQEWMSVMMKQPEHKYGVWLWRFKKDGMKVYGQYLGERDD